MKRYSLSAADPLSFLGIDGQEIFPSTEPGQAALYILVGAKL
ncbi:hypothetical protein [Desulfuromonas sp. KJ2020]|nr:hypothetical protein [Desulfuromonas sp. KJ2020]